ncbi:hypothetical protein BDV18DRAFT_159155 [Aspergillus unguis]
MPSLQSSTLSLALLVAGHLHARCCTAPNKPSTPHSIDRIRFLTTNASTIFTSASNLATIYQAAVTLFSTASPSDKAIVAKLCPHLAHLSPETTSWTRRTSVYLALIALGASVRLGAYGGLGRNFTFQLAQPDRLVTGGVYRYLQHPSYTGIALVLGGYAGLIVNQFDTPVATLLSDNLVKRLRELQGGIVGVVVVVFATLVAVRIRDEERMLRERFGEEWEEWHCRTARLIPFIF